MASSGKRVLVLNKTYPQAGLDILKENGIQTTVLTSAEEDPGYRAEIRDNVRNGYDGFVWNTKEKLNAEIIDLAGPQLKAVTSMSSGLDHIDQAELKRRGIALGSTPGALNDTVAELTVGLMIAAGRNFKDGIQKVERGEWKYGVQWYLGQGIQGRTVGIVGLGGIGQSLVKMLKPFQVDRFLYTGRKDKPEAQALGVERVPLEQLLRESDYVVLCCPYTEETRHLINARTLQMMKSTAVLVNIARGGVVDTSALYEALRSRQIFAAGLDVVEPEPIHADHPIVALPNCVLIPHYGSATVQTRNKMASLAARNVAAALQGEPMPSPALL